MAKPGATIDPMSVSHPLYDELRWWWRFFELSYLGGREYLQPDISSPWPITVTTYDDTQTPTGRQLATLALDSFLWRHNREEEGDYKQRKQRSYFRNLCKPIVDTYAAHVFAKEISRDAGTAPVLDAFWQDVNLRGDAITPFMLDGLTLAQVFGHVFCAVDMPRLQAEPRPLSMADEAARMARPYACWFSPLSVPDWEIDDLGEFEWIKLVETSDVVARGDAGETPQNAPAVMRVWYRDHWELWGSVQEARDKEAHGVLLEEGANPLGRVPVEVLYSQRRPGESEPVGESRIRDIAMVNREIYNLDSLKQDLLYHQGFAFLAIPDPNKRLNVLDLGVHRAFAYDPGAGGVPQYVGPPTEYVTSIREEIADLILQIRAMAGLSRGLGEQSIAARSGDALLFETHDKAAMLAALATQAQDFETRIAYLATQWMRQPWDASVVYPDDYSATALGEDLDVALKYAQLEPPGKAKGHVLERVTRRLLRKLPEEDMGEVVEEIREESEGRPDVPPGQDEQPGNRPDEPPGLADDDEEPRGKGKEKP